MTAPGPGDVTDIRRALLEMKARQRLAEKAERERIVPVSRDGKLAVAEQQRYLWFMHQLAPDSPAYNVPYALRLRGDLDVDALRTAWCALVARHESLRTRFGDEHGVPYLIIDPAPPEWPMPVVDGAGHDVQSWIDAQAAIPFDLANGPLCRTSLLRLAPDDHVLFLGWHHIVNDGWSARRISEEVSLLYASARLEATAALAPLAIQPADYAAWQRRWLLGDEPEKQISYWRQRLAGAEVLEFPADRPRPVHPTLDGTVLEAALPAALSRKLRAFAKLEGVSLFAVLLAGFQVVLGRYSGQEDLVCGTTLSGRTRSEVEPLVGFFATTVALRGSLAGDPAFRELARRCNNTLIEAMSHQDIPFGTLVEALQPERLAGRNPLFQHAFSLIPASMVPAWEFPGVDVEMLTARQGSSRFDFTFQVTDEPSGDLSLWIEYSTELYDRDRIGRLADHFTTLLSAAVEAPDARIASLDVLPDTEFIQVLAEWNPPAGRPDERLLHELFTQRAAEAPDRVAMRFAGAELTYGELDQRSNRLAHALAEEFKLTTGGVVAVLLDRGFDLPVAELAALKAGGAWLPLDPQHPADRIAYQLTDASVTVVVTTSDLADRLPPDTPRITLDTTTLDHHPDTPPQVLVHPEAAAYIIYTSGSTGRPKGVMVPHRAVVNFCTTFCEMFSVTPDDRILQFSNPAFDVSVSDFFATFTAGATVIGAPRSVLLDPDSLQSLLARERVSLVDIPPAILGMLDPAPLTDLRILFIGMEPFPAELVNRWAHPQREFHNGYGPTEATITCVDYHCPPQPLNGPPPIGRAMTNQRAYVLDKHLNPTPIGIPGQLHIAGAGLAHGYLNRPDLTTTTFLPDPYAPTPGQRMYATGDMARWRPDGNLEFLGRVDRQIKIRGLRIELGEIEHTLTTHPAVRQATITVKDPNTPHARLIGYVTPEPGASLDPSQVRDYAADRLPLHMVPAALVALDELPLTSSGKLDPARLPDPEPGPTVGPVVLATETQQRLAQIWEGLLNLPTEQIGARDSFFALGGNSLQVTQLISRIRDAFQVTIDPRQLFTHPVLEQLAAQIEDAQRAALDDGEFDDLQAQIATLSEAELDRLLGETS